MKGLEITFLVSINKNGWPLPTQDVAEVGPRRKVPRIIPQSY